jgi:hypothetical protein
MRSRFPTRRTDARPALRSLLALAVVALLPAFAAACGHDPAPATSAVSHAEPDRVLVGPQGSVGQFVVECGLAHRGNDDPIVHPGHPGASHLHQFFGAVGVDADSQYDALVTGDTTCQQQADTAAYWAPVLLDHEHQPIEALRSVAYYRAGPGVDPADVSDYPPGLMLVAGDANATEPQPVSVVSWSCGTGAVRQPTPPDCSGAPSLRMIVTYQDCWNGVDLASDDWSDPARRHAVYSSGGECPATHPVHIPQLQFAIDYPPVAAETLDDLALSSGDIHSGHADFWNTWDQDKLRTEIAVCIRRDLVCEVSG